jgi:hypothetical protein
MRTNPRLSGLSWHTDAVKPGKVCRRSPMRSVEKVMKCTCTSGVATRSSVRKNAPA